MRVFLLLVLVFVACESRPTAPPMQERLKTPLALVGDAVALEGEVPDGTSPLTVVVRLRLDKRPHGKAAVVSRWDLKRGRSFELGVDAEQRPYVATSSRGDKKSIREVRSDYQIPLAREVELAFVYEPGAALSLYLDGNLARVEKNAIPRALHIPADIGVQLGRRPGGGKTSGVVGQMSSLMIEGRALGREEMKSRGPDRPLPRPFAPAKQLTSGPGFHWFGYYDKRETDPSGRYVLAHQVNFEGRHPSKDDLVKVGMTDTQDDNKWIELGETRAWNWQQGSMLQWRPGSETEVLWNDRDDDATGGPRFVTRVLDVKTRALRTLPDPVYHVAENGRLAVGVDFARIDAIRPGYGYAGIARKDHDDEAPDSWIYLVDLDSGERTDVINLRTLKDEFKKVPPPEDSRQFFNHLQWNPSGTRFLFLHRYRTGKRPTKETRLVTSDLTGKDLRVVDEGRVSHYTWWNDTELVVYTTRTGYALFEDKPQGLVRSILRYENGHQTMLPGGEWMLTDTYPERGTWRHRPFLYNLKTDEIVVLGYFKANAKFRQTNLRVDAHPRLDPTGTRVFIDSQESGARQIHEIDISGIIKP